MMIVRRRTLLGLMMAGLCVPASRARASAGIAAPIAALNAGLLQVMRAGAQTPFPARYEMLAGAVDRAFDLRAILRVSVGQAWATLNGDERQELFAVFRQFTIASYVSNFHVFNDDHFEVLPDQRAVGADQVVATRIVPASGDAIRMDYVMRQEAGNWRAVDVLLDGTISRVAVQRSDFRALLARGAAKALTDSLRKKVVDLSGGSLS